MSLILAGIVVAGVSGAMMVGRWLTKKKADTAATTDADAKTEKKDAPDDAPDPPRSKAPPKSKSKPKTKEPPKDPALEGFPCQLGDVLMRMTGEEAWLAGGVVLSEDMPVSVLFIAPDAGSDRAIYVRPKPDVAVQWLAPLDASDVLVSGEPPTSVEHERVRFERVRRLPLRPKRVGVGAPELGDTIVVAEYASAGAERMLVLKGSSGEVRAYRGIFLEPSTYEVIASGRTTLDDV